MLIAAVTLGHSTVARAARPSAQPTLSLNIDVCVDIDAASWARLVALTLKAKIVSQEEAAAGHVYVSCKNRMIEVTVGDPAHEAPLVSATTAQSLLELRLDDPLTGKTLQRWVDLNEQPVEARPRLLAIAVSELVRASWLELLWNPEPEVPPVRRDAGAPDPALVAAATGTLARPRLQVQSGIVVLDAKNPWVLVGLGARLEGGAPTFWSVGTQLQGGRTNRRDGVVTGFAAQIVAQVGHLARFDRWFAAASAGGAIGGATLDGQGRANVPIVGGKAQGVIGGPLLELRAGHDWTAWHLELGLAAGWALLGVEATVQDDSIVRYGGPWLALQLGAGFGV